MKPSFSQALLADISSSVEGALAAGRIVNVSALAQQVQSKNQSANVALEDIAAELMRLAQGHGAAMEFDGDWSLN
jgi:hypothetical protein